MSRVCVFGDSISWGSWDPAGGGWVGRLREAGCNRLDPSDLDYVEYVAVYNCGISGNKLADVLVRFDVETRAREADAVVIAIGINDVPRSNYFGTTPEDFTRGYVDLIAQARTHVNDIVLVTPTNVDESRHQHDYRNADISRLVDAVEKCASEAGLPVVNVFGLMTPEDLDPDGIHPGPGGHDKLFRHIGPVVFGLPSLNV